MLVVFEILVAQGHDPDALISEETQKSTMAQVMTLEDAEKVGFTGLKPDPKGRETRLVAVAKRDSQWVQRQLEANPAVSGFRVHEVDE